MEYDVLLLLCLAAFCAGFVDSIVGGGGLIQTPISLALLPNLPVSTVIGSLKIPAFFGTALATTQYVKKVKLDFKLLIIFAIVAYSSAFLGSQLLSVMSNDFMKPVLLLVLITLFIYTLFKKDFGQAQDRLLPKMKVLQLGILVCLLVGFYDGFIGPATGTFLLLGFVSLLGMDFLKANTHAKLINLATNFGSICLFLLKGQIIWNIALPMAICNATGGFVGAKIAIDKGNKFIRVVFLCVILLSILRFGYDVVMG